MNHYYGMKPFSVGKKIRCVKEPDNCFDSEAIKVVMKEIGTVGYVMCLALDKDCSIILEEIVMPDPDMIGYFRDYFGEYITDGYMYAKLITWRLHSITTLLPSIRKSLALNIPDKIPIRITLPSKNRYKKSTYRFR